MKILHITPAYHPAIQWGGPVVSVRILAKEQKKLGHSVEVYTTALGLPQNKSQSVELDGLMVRYFNFFTVKRWFISFPLLRKVWENRNAFDVFDIHLVWDPVCWMAGILLVILGKKIIISPHGTVEQALVDRRSKFLKMFFYKLFLKYIFRHAHGFRFTADDERDKFFAFTGMKDVRAKVVINPFDSGIFEHMTEDKEFASLGLVPRKYFLYFGRVNWKKRLEILVKAFAALAEGNPEYKLVVAGASDSDYESKLKQCIDAEHARDRCVLLLKTIPVDSPLKVVLFQNACAFVLPSFSENFGFVAVEALASGAPLIVSDGVAIGKMITRYGAGRVFVGSSLTDAEATEHLLSEMRYILDEGHRRVLIAGGRELLNGEFDNACIARQVVDLYQND